MRMHHDEFEIDHALVRALVDNALPEYRALPLTPMVATGSTNLNFRLGDSRLVRVPRQPGGSRGIRREHRWTPVIAPRLPVAIPGIEYVGDPTADYPEHWSVIQWLDGRHPETWETAPGSSASLAEDLAALILAFRTVDLPVGNDAALDNYRGRTLAEHDPVFRRNIDGCRQIPGLSLDLDRALAVWIDALSCKTDITQKAWYHSDIVAENLLVKDGRLVALLDLGGVGIGDPVIDLHGAWELFDAPSRAIFRAALDVSDEDWARARAWALAIPMMTFTYYWETMPGRVSSRLAMARAALAEA